MFILAASRVEGGVPLEKWKSEGCPYCGMDHNVKAVQFDGVEIVRCNECHTVFIVPDGSGGLEPSIRQIVREEVAAAMAAEKE